MSMNVNIPVNTLASFNTIPSVRRIHRRLRTLNSAYMESEDKSETRMVLQAHVNELKLLHELLPPPVRRKSWILTIERHGTW